jgi:hypothetical protein
MRHGPSLRYERRTDAPIHPARIARRPSRKRNFSWSKVTVAETLGSRVAARGVPGYWEDARHRRQIAAAVTRKSAMIAAWFVVMPCRFAHPLQAQHLLYGRGADIADAFDSDLVGGLPNLWKHSLET